MIWTKCFKDAIGEEGQLRQLSEHGDIISDTASPLYMSEQKYLRHDVVPSFDAKHRLHFASKLKVDHKWSKISRCFNENEIYVDLELSYRSIDLELKQFSVTNMFSSDLIFQSKSTRQKGLSLITKWSPFDCAQSEKADMDHIPFSRTQQTPFNYTYVGFTNEKQRWKL